jgi:TonB family protein
MHSRTRWIVFCAATSLFGACSASGRTNTLESNPPAYQNSDSGLKHLIQDATAAARQHDRDKLAQLTNSMLLPSPEQWFLKVFGPEWGNVYSRLYMENNDHAAADLANIFAEAVAQNYSIEEIRQFKNACDFTADKDEYPMLAARVIPEPFSVVRFVKGQEVRTLRFIAYVDGGFRFIGLLRVPADLYPGVAKSMGLKPGVDPPVDPISVSADLQRAKMIHGPAPSYPMEARQRHIEGKVVIHSIIETDGTIGDVRVMLGQCPFAKEAVRAVKQWKFNPTLVGGIAVRTSTVWELNFKLSGR